MRGILIGLLLLISASLTSPPAAAQDNSLHLTRAQSVINAFQVMCTLEHPNFDQIDEKATLMRMRLQSNDKGPSADNTVTRSKVWAGGLTDGPFVVLLDEMSGAKGTSTSCAIVADVPDVDAFLAEAVSMIKLPGVPAPELGTDGSRSYVWNGFFGPGTIIIERDFARTGKPGVMLKLLSMVRPAQ
jgi:hypothetical protein